LKTPIAADEAPIAADQKTKVIGVCGGRVQALNAVRFTQLQVFTGGNRRFIGGNRRFQICVQLTPRGK
jgi:hypothetical protein